MGIRARKNHLITVLKAHLISKKLTLDQVGVFEAMYRRASSTDEQDAVTRAVHAVIDGWKGAGGGVYGHLRRLKAGLDLYDDEDPPALQEALIRAQVNLRR